MFTSSKGNRNPFSLLIEAVIGVPLMPQANGAVAERQRREKHLEDLRRAEAGKWQGPSFPAKLLLPK